jgi:hypothetical protein
LKIRVVKAIAPIKINNHWVYRVDDTVEIDLDILPFALNATLSKKQRDDAMPVIEQFIQSQLEK